MWSAGQLWGSPADGMTRVFLWVPLLIVAVPWGYVLDTYVLGRGNVRRASARPATVEAG